MVKQRSVALAVILSLVTCGIYNLYWMYALTNEVGHLSEEKGFTGGKELLLILVTCGIWALVWYYKLGQNIAKAQQLKGGVPKDDSVLFLILGIFGFGIIAEAIAQGNVNKLV